MIDELGHARRRDGAYAWGIYKDVADVGRFVETFTIESWLELMHQHERVTNADETLDNHLRTGFAIYSRRRRASRFASPQNDLTELGESRPVESAGQPGTNGGRATPGRRK
jgi:hypothetical protein